MPPLIYACTEMATKSGGKCRVAAQRVEIAVAGGPLAGLRLAGDRRAQVLERGVALPQQRLRTGGVVEHARVVAVLAQRLAERVARPLGVAPLGVQRRLRGGLPRRR